jgi:hypothetical protein
VLLTRNSKVLLAAALGLALLMPQSKADQPNGSNPPAPAKTAKDTGKTVKDAKKVTKGTKKKAAKGTKKTTRDTKKVIRTAKKKAKDRTIDNRIVPPGPGC